MSEDRTLEIKGEGMARGQKVQIKELPMNKIKLGRNSRLQMQNEDLSALMQSINSTGLLEPIGVVQKGDHYQIAYGNRRFMAFSRLGLHSIPAVVHTNADLKKADVMNLAENVQRRQISLAEIGRYAKLLEDEGLSRKELAVRLGVTNNYVETCIEAYHEVPKDFRADLEINVGGEKKNTPGKISLHSAKAIIHAKKAYGLGERFKKELFKLAKNDPRFEPKQVPDYIAAMKRGAEDPIGSVKPVKTVTLNLMLSKDEYDALCKKHIAEGPFNSFTALLKAILQGKKAVAIKSLE